MPSPVAVTPTTKAPAAIPSSTGERLYEVVEEIKIPRGASSFTLRAGKTISSIGYDIDQLILCGAKLKLKSS